MRIVHGAAELRAQIAQYRRAGERIGLVPTMGNLHAGHYSLVELARERSARVVASVFVNPTQFGPNEDYAAYPRTLDADAAGLRERGCDLLFAPSVDVMYPGGMQADVRVEVPVLSTILCGASRPGHFSGVATVVSKLFNLVQPDLAVFGQKDYQQLLVIRRLVGDLAFPIEIVSGATVREPSGLAMSSRNQYLNPDERARAAVIYATLTRIADRVRAGAPIERIEGGARAELEAAGLGPDYAVVRRAEDLAVPDERPAALVAMIAARVGRARLIDNLLI